MILTLAGNLLVILVQLVGKGNFLASFYFQYNQLQYNAKNTRPWSSKAQISDGSQQRHLQQVIMQSSHAKPHNGHTNHLVSDESPFQTPSSGQRRNHLCQCDKSKCLGPSLLDLIHLAKMVHPCPSLESTDIQLSSFTSGESTDAVKEKLSICLEVLSIPPFTKIVIVHLLFHGFQPESRP